MTPTTPDPADGDAMKAREIIEWLKSTPPGMPDLSTGEYKDALNYIAAALSQARKDGARAQYEKDCAVVCEYCAKGFELAITDDVFFHVVKEERMLPRFPNCDAAAIRAAFESDK